MAERIKTTPPTEHGLFGKIDQHKSDIERLTWEGSFGEYVDMVVANPDLVRTAHQTAYQALTADEDFFTKGRFALFGAEKTTSQFIDVLKAGAEGLAIGKRIVLLVGPPGSGKTTLVNGTKRGIEDYSRTDEGAVYAIKGCQMHEDPLHLIPKDMRPMLEEEYGIKIEGELCPRCAHEYGGKNFTTEALKEVPITRVLLSEKERVGVGTFKPSDPKSQDITELVGSVDYSKIGEFGSGAHPLAYRFDGELNKANRGVMEFVEMLKSDVRFLYSLLDLAEDRVIKSPGFANISADEVILAHTNLTEYNSFTSDRKNEALLDRMVVIWVPYNLRVSDEVKVHEKLIGESKQVRAGAVHINPLSLKTAATFAVLSRLKPTAKYSKIQKLKIYDGQDTESLTERDLREMQAEHENEGLSGISPRYIIDSLSMALTKKPGEAGCLTPMDTLKALQENLSSHAHTRDMSKDEKEALLADLAAAKTEFDAAAMKEVQGAFVYAFDDTARSLCDNYLANVEAYSTKTKILDPITDEETDPDEKLMRSIEEQIHVSDAGKKEFRNELLMRIGSTLRAGKEFDYTTHPKLREAIQKKLFAGMKDMITLTTSSPVKNEEQQKRVGDVITTLIEDKGYCPHCATELVNYVSRLLSRT